jgi:DNA mismatch repair protein MLH1
MTHLTTFGFRGEALASISDMANVTVYTKTKDASFGFK